jgi:hypothetical protein
MHAFSAYEQSIGNRDRTLTEWLHLCTTTGNSPDLACAGRTRIRNYTKASIGSYDWTLMDWMHLYDKPEDAGCGNLSLVAMAGR